MVKDFAVKTASEDRKPTRLDRRPGRLSPGVVRVGEGVTQVHGWVPAPDLEVDHLDEDRERHREVDVPLRDVHVEALGDEAHPDQEQEAQGEHLHRGVAVDEGGDRPREDHHDRDGQDDRQHHHDELARHADRGDHRVEGEDHVEERDLHEDGAERGGPAAGALVLGPLELVVDLEGALGEQEQDPDGQDQVASGDLLPEDGEQRGRQPHDPAIERGDYDSVLLHEFLKETGELGQLAQLLDTMANNILQRNTQLMLLNKVIPIGVSLSAEKDFNRLLESLVVEAQAFTHADAGSLYLVEEDKLRFVILRNSSLDMKMGGTSGTPIPFYPVRMYNEDGSENRSNVVSYAALTHKRINIADAYEAEGFDFSGTKSFDEKTRYRSKSFLTIPLENKEGKVMGVLQLINAKNPKTGEIIPFSDDNVLER